jgi:hypothetical protein
LLNRWILATSSNSELVLAFEAIVTFLMFYLCSALGSVIMEISYGVRDPAYTEALIDDAEALIAGFGEVAVPGRFLVDIFPILRYVPSWLPGAGWKRRLDVIAAKSRDVYQRTFDDAKERAVRAMFLSTRTSC